MKKVFLIIGFICLIITGCKKKTEKLENKNLSFSSQEVVCNSFYNDDSFKINLEIYDLKDTDDYCNGFFVEGTYDDFLKEVVNFDDFYEIKNEIVRFLHNGQYYIIQLSRQFGDCFSCKFVSEYVVYTLMGEGLEDFIDRIAIPFPRIDNTPDSHTCGNRFKYSNDKWEFFKSYYANQSYFQCEISDDEIKINNFESANDGILNISIKKTNYIQVIVIL